jgi:hypothetical protein
MTNRDGGGKASLFAPPPPYAEVHNKQPGVQETCWPASAAVPAYLQANPPNAEAACSFRYFASEHSSKQQATCKQRAVSSGRLNRKKSGRAGNKRPGSENHN